MSVKISVKAIWDQFLACNDRLWDPPDEDAMNELLRLLQNIDKRLSYHLREHDQGLDLILSAEGHPELMQVLARMRKAAPNPARWEVITAFSGIAVLGERDWQVFPNDASGDALYRMYMSGDALWISRPVDFNLLFPGEHEAKLSCEALDVELSRVGLSEYRDVEGFTYEVQLSIDMCPTYPEIVRQEAHLAEVACRFGGMNDGWGSWEVQEGDRQCPVVVAQVGVTPWA